ncbi:GTPase-associated protein 1-related protein [Streptomyces syringium]|uniref:GTPase-associated protein 1-related protein n=1 Tax=Streptomyces syringium TaxID=76729 RepID=UPI00368EEC85
MNLPQLHYTSAAPGPDGSGFRFTAVSAALPTALLGEVEQLVGYEPPRDAPGRPTRDELAVFPVAFSHNTLSDGSRLLCRTVYTGTDYSGRYGNFHAHAVRLPEDGSLPGGLLPIEAWESPSWTDRTPEERHPGPLTTLTPARRVDRAGLIRFCRARADRLEPFLADVRALLHTPDAPQLLVVERDSADTAHWIAVASAVLPRDRADRLTFTTYTRRPQLARQQIIGTLPDADFDLAGAAADHRYRVHDCAGGHSSPARPEPDPWAAVAARVWLADRPELFAEAARTGHDTGSDAGLLAVLAARAGIALDATGRTAAARAAHEHTRADDTLWPPLLTTLAAGGTDRTPEEWTALAALAEEFSRLADDTATAPLRGDLHDALDRATAAPDSPLGPLLALLGLADALHVDPATALPPLTARLTTTLLDGTAEDRQAVRTALAPHDALTATVLDNLDQHAATDDPGRVSHALAALPDADLTGHPHLRMAREFGVLTADGRLRPDRPALLDALMKAAGAEHRAEPSVLRAAFRLVQGDRPLRPVEAGTLLAQLPAAWHRAAGLDEVFIQAALDSAPDDREAPDLAKALLVHCASALAPRQRAALLLLELAGELTTGEAQPGFTERALAVRPQAAPLEPGIEKRLGRALADRLLAERQPPGELRALIHSGDETLLRAYTERARGDGVGSALRRSPSYAAACFVAWHTASGADPLWERTRTELLSSVLKPVVRRMPAEDVDALLESLRRRGGGWAEAFGDWHRPGVLGRLGGRWRGRGGRAPGPAYGPGDIERPGEEHGR